MKVNATVSNVKGFPRMPKDHAYADMDNTINLALDSTALGVVFWSEISNHTYKKLLRSLSINGLKTRFLNTEIPITYDSREWEELKHDYVRVHRGIPLVSPARGITWLVLRCRTGGPAVVFMNTHYVSGAWNEDKKRMKKWRQRQWIKHWRVQDALVNKFHEAGLTVIGGGDFNRFRVERFNELQKWYDHSIIKVFVVPGDNIKRMGHLGCEVDHKNFSDHPIISEQFVIQPK